jgi:hypothetical protein
VSADALEKTPTSRKQTARFATRAQEDDRMKRLSIAVALAAATRGIIAIVDAGRRMRLDASTLRDSSEDTLSLLP